jgi:hypothetical protein
VDPGVERWYRTLDNYTTEAFRGKAVSKEIEQYQVHEIVLTAPGQSDPFSASVSVVFTHQDRTRLEVPAFYDGGDKWRVRVSPSKVGRWTAEVSGDVAGFEESKLPDLTFVPSKDPGGHGRLGVSDEYPHRFAFEDGTAALPLGFEWNWMTAYHQEHGVGRDDSPNPTFKGALDRIQAGGFNYIVANLYADYYHKTPNTDETKPYLYQHPRLYPFGGTNDAPDHSVLNPAFFQDLDKAVEELNRRHIILHLMIQVQNKKVNWPEPGSSEDDQFWRYVVARYQAYPNIVWDLSKESYNLLKRTGSHEYALSRVKLIRETDAHANLVTAHDTERESWGRSTELDDACDFITDQVKFSGTVDGWERGSATRLNAEAIRRWRNVDKPYLNVEYGYEEGQPPHVAPIPKMTVSGDTMLMWTWALLAGGAYANYYYCNTSWDLCRFDMSPESWERFRYLKDFVDPVDLHTMVPDNDYASAGMCSSRNGESFLVYLPDGGNTRIDLSQCGETDLRATWMDTHTGERMETGVEERGFWKELVNPLAGGNPCVVYVGSE